MSKKSKIMTPAILASPTPFRFIKKSDKDVWNPTIENINRSTYDYVRLHRITGTFDIGLPDNHLLAITFDGSFILPAIKDFIDIHKSVDKFNDFFGRIMLGGVYIQAIDPTYVQNCFVYQNHYFRTVGSTNNAFSELKNSFRHKIASKKDNIILLTTNFIYAYDILEAYNKGKKYLDMIKNLTPSILIKGVSAYILNSYAESLTYNWVSIEQVIDYIWEQKFINSDSNKAILGRKDFLEDTRTWTSSTRIEMFFQKSIINENLYNNLSKVRKARNKFVHTGQTPLKDDATIAFNTLFEIISLVFTEYKTTSEFDLLKKKYLDFDPIKRTFYEERNIEEKDIKYFLNSPIPNIPGDEKWKSENYSFDIGFDFDK